MTKRPLRLPLRRDRIRRLAPHELSLARGGDPVFQPCSRRGCDTLDTYIITACPTTQTQ